MGPTSYWISLEYSSQLESSEGGEVLYKGKSLREIGCSDYRNRDVVYRLEKHKLVRF